MQDSVEHNNSADSQNLNPVVNSTTKDNVITLQVGERRFKTTKETLKGSGYFTGQTSGDWDGDKQDDESFFVDADPHLFEHILRYFRRKVFPLFYDNVKGHNHSLYFALYKEADYFVVRDLAKWLKDKEYLKAVQTEVTSGIVVGVPPLERKSDLGEQIEYHPTWRTKKVYNAQGGLQFTEITLLTVAGDVPTHEMVKTKMKRK